MPDFTDQMGRQIHLKTPPQRIVSLVPSQSELLHFLGLEDEVAGITKFCIYPDDWFRNKTRIGGTKQVKMEVVAQLQPDLIIGNKEENQKEQIKALAEKYPVWMSDIHDLNSALAMISAIGDLTGTWKKAERLVSAIQKSFSALENEAIQPPLRVAYFIWYNPYMVVASNTFIDDMLQKLGFENVFKDQQRYPEVEAGQLQALKPEVILLSSEPFPFKEKHIIELKKICPEAVIKLVDGALFSWYGSRLLHSVAYFRNLSRELRKSTN
jgi:ABC-type Fe3+-hydroxamate transport system substrate-binding protein